jgi:tRNA(Ile)-lysidine synthase
MIHRVISTIKRYKLFRETDKLLLAVSGGVDSTVLVHLLQTLDYPIAIAHVNYGLRGEESDQDEEFVRELGKTIKVPVYINRFDTEKIASKTDKSVQMVARQLRYEWFHQLLEEHDLEYIVTGHHADDNLETALFNLSKGTGISGLRGIPVVSNLVRRPMIHVSKEELITYARSHHLKWREDASNEDDKYNRNLIRNRVIPEMRKINPSLSEHYSHTQRRLIGPEKLLKNHVAKIRERSFREFGKGRWELRMNWLEDDEIDLVVLYEILQDFNFSFSMVDQIFDNKDGQPGRSFMNARFKLTTDRERLLIEERTEDSPEELHMIWEDQLEVAFGRFVLNMQETFSIDTGAIKSEDMAALDRDRLQYPLVLRKWEAGDSFIPLGMKHQKKISDFLIDEKVSVPAKNEQFVLLSGDQICWVIGRRISENFKVTDDTDKVLVLRVHSQD